jgi:hypothetical protein
MKLIQTSAVATALAILLTLAGSAGAASVGATGYTNAFGTLLAAADWSFISVAGSAGDIIDVAGMDPEVQKLTAAGISTQLESNTGNPPDYSGNAR